MRRKTGKQIIKQIANENGISVDEVRRDMELAINEAYDNAETRQEWSKMFGEGVLPTPEEFICTISKEVRNLSGEIISH